MDQLSLLELATATGGRLDAADARKFCLRISTDSRDIQWGDVFWALVGENFDGHNFAARARANGAQLVVCQSDRAESIPAPRLIVDDTLAAFGRLAQWYRRRQPAKVIGVTGSVGKTTTKDLIHAALNRQLHGVRSPGNFNNTVGLPKSLLAIEGHHQYAVLELGAAKPGDIRELAELAQPEIGAITNIGKAHLASFGTIEQIALAKGELLEALPRSGFAVLPGDDPLTRSLANRAACRTILVGEEPHNEVRAERVTSTLQELKFRVQGDYFRVPWAGRHLLTNALIAIAIAREMGVSAATIADGLREFEPAAGRGRWLRCGSWTVIDDTYNASPTSVAAACELLAAAPGGKRYLVLGDMLELGETASVEHAVVGELAAQAKCDGVLALGDFADDVARGAGQQGLHLGRLVTTRDLDVLLTVLDCWLEPGDVVLVKGSRKMRMERVIEWLTQQGSSSSGSPMRRCA